MMKEHDRCLRCGRKLKNPEARLKGFGSVCEKKMERVKRYCLLENKWKYRAKDAGGK